MGTRTGGKYTSSTKSQRPRRYDKDLIRDRTLDVLSESLGPPREQGARAVWDCPACGKREKYSVVKASGKGGCLVADCRLAGSGDIFVMMAGLENLDYKADFLAVLARSYELLGLEPTDNRSDSQDRSQRAAGKGANMTGAGPQVVPVGRQARRPDSLSEKEPRRSADEACRTSDPDAHLQLAARVYERILELCPLESRDRAYLRKRGLSNATIKRGRFGTMTAPRASQVKALLQRELGREALLSVPGFSGEEETGRVKFTLTGRYILIPYQDTKGRVTTIEGRIVGRPTDGRKYVTLRRAGNHLYLFPGHRPEDLVAVCEGAMGAMVAAESGIAVGAIMGCERFRASPSPEMLDGNPGDPLLELKGADFGGRAVPYIPDADNPPNPNVLRAAPKAARWIAEPQNGKAAICLLPEGTDLDEWLLSLDPRDRADRFAELLYQAEPPEDDQSIAPPALSFEGGGEPAPDVARDFPKDGDAPASGPEPQPPTARPATPSPAGTDLDATEGKDAVPAPGGGPATTEDLRQGSDTAKASRNRSSRKRTKKQLVGDRAQPGLWDEPEQASDADESSQRAAAPGVSRGARKLRDEVYRALIEKLPPKEEHLAALEKLGVMRATARVGRFASLRPEAAETVVSELTERFGRKRLLTVPGFEANEGGRVNLTMALARSEEHVLIPCFDADGLLAGVEGLPFDHRSGELDAEETVPLMGAGAHLYVFAHYPPGWVEGFCEGPLGAMLAAQQDVVIGAIGGFRRYRAASGPGEGRQAADAALPELEGVDLAGHRVAYVPRSGVGESNARYHEAPKAARWLVGRQGGDPAVVGLATGKDSAEEGHDGPSSLGEWICTLAEDEAHDRLREIFPESPAREEAPEDAGTGEPPTTNVANSAPPLPRKAVLVSVAVAAALGLALGVLLPYLRGFAGYVSTTPAGEPVLYSGPLGPLRRLADAEPFHLLYDLYPVVVLAAVAALALLFVSKARAQHLARWRSSRLRLRERWELHAVPVSCGSSAAVFTRDEALWGALAWPLGYLLSGWLLAALEGALGLAANLPMTPETGTLVADPGTASLCAATALSAFVLWRRRSIRTAEARMLAGKIRH